ncbi:MAG TPA: DUF84 family protein [Trueperaceae bacterium]|nr:DUF84 family protein [Trueperaceae bacterium]
MREAAHGLIALGSGNPVKRRALEGALGRLLGAELPRLACMEVASGVPGQPWGDAQTRRGAANRARAALEGAGAHGAAIGVGLEGGVAAQRGRLWAFSWAVALTARGDEAAARSAAFALPVRVAAMVEGGLELGEAMDRVFGVRGSKRDQGAVGLLTGGALGRAELYEQPALLALAPLLLPDLHRG